MITIEITYPDDPPIVLSASDPVEAMYLVSRILEFAQLQDLTRLDVRVTGGPTAAACRRPDLYPTGV